MKQSHTVDKEKEMKEKSEWKDNNERKKKKLVTHFISI